MIKNFTQKIMNDLGYYVYIYLDPRNDEIFYVGKGKNNRCFAHLSDDSDSEKVKRINEIRQENKEPIIEMLIHGVTEDTALKVEASVIDLIDVKKLTNKVKGHSSSKIGRMSLEKLVSIYNPEKAVITEPSLLIKISQSFRGTHSKFVFRVVRITSLVNVALPSLEVNYLVALLVIVLVVDEELQDVLWEGYATKRTITV